MVHGFQALSISSISISSTVSNCFCYEKIKSLEFDYAVVACSILIKPELLNTMPEVRFSTHASTPSKLQDKLTRRALTRSITAGN